MKIRPSADFSAIHAEPAIQQSKPDALTMQAEPVLLILASARLDFPFVQSFSAKIFLELQKAVQSLIRKTETEDFGQIILSTQMNSGHTLFGQDTCL